MSEGIVEYNATTTALDLTGDGIPLFDQLKGFVQEKLVEGVHYGKSVAGAKVMSLWKGGAEILGKEFGLAIIVEEDKEERVVDHENQFYSYTYRAHAMRVDTGEVVPGSEEYGTANSKERTFSAGNSDKAFAHHRVISIARKRVRVACVITTLGISSLFTHGMEDVRQGGGQSTSGPAPDIEKLRKKAFAMASKMGISDEDMKKECYSHFVRPDGELIESRKEMTVKQWTALIDEYQKRLDETREINRKADDKLTQNRFKDQASNEIGTLIDWASGCLSITSQAFDGYLSSVYLAMPPEFASDPPLSEAIVGLLSKAKADKTILAAIKKDYEAYCSWYQQIGDDKFIDDFIRQVCKLSDDKTVKLFGSLGIGPNCKSSERLRSIPPDMFKTWPEKLSELMTTGGEEDGEIPFV